MPRSAGEGDHHPLARLPDLTDTVLRRTALQPLVDQAGQPESRASRSGAARPGTPAANRGAARLSVVVVTAPLLVPGERVEGPRRHCGSGAPKGNNTIYRPGPGSLFRNSPGVGVCGDRVCVTGNHRPRTQKGVCGVRPGECLTGRAILMALCPSVHPLYGLKLNCSVLLNFHHLVRQPAPLPVLHFPWLGTPLPDSQHARPQPGAFTGIPRIATAGTTRLNFTCWYCTCTTAVPLTVTPDHCGPPGPAAGPVALLHLLWLQGPTTVPTCELLPCCPPVHVWRVPLDCVYGRNTNHNTEQCLLQPAQISRCSKER